MHERFEMINLSGVQRHRKEEKNNKGIGIDQSRENIRGKKNIRKRRIQKKTTKRRIEIPERRMKQLLWQKEVLGKVLNKEDKAELKT